MPKKVFYYDPSHSINVNSVYDIYKYKPDGYDVIGYYEVGDFIKGGGKGDVLVFGTDVIPYTAYPLSYSDFINGVMSDLYYFLYRGGTVIWDGELPFMYRVKCEDGLGSDFIDRLYDGLLEETSTSFLTTYFSTTKHGNTLCYTDMIHDVYLTPGRAYHLPIAYKHLGHIPLSSSLHLELPVSVRVTIVGKLLGLTCLPTLVSLRKRTPFISLREFDLDDFRAKRYGRKQMASWLLPIGEGSFIYLYDSDLLGVPDNVFKVADRIAGVY